MPVCHARLCPCKLFFFTTKRKSRKMLRNIDLYIARPKEVSYVGNA